MRIRFLGPLIVLFIFSGCVSIPDETVLLSSTMGKDIKVLQQSHKNSISVLFGGIKRDINSFVEDVYAPFVIHYVLQKEMQAYLKGEESLYTAIEAAGKKGGKEDTEAAIKVMDDFLVSARRQIENKRIEILAPVLKRELEILREIDRSYDNVIYANTSITNYLQSARKIKNAQQEALSNLGLEGMDGMITKNLVEVSEKVSAAVEMGREIDVKSDNAFGKLEGIVNQIKNLTN